MFQHIDLFDHPNIPLETRMTTRSTPSFHAHHVGSFLRPKYLLDAREQFFTKKEITAEQLRLVEDMVITEIVLFQAPMRQPATTGRWPRCCCPR